MDLDACTIHYTWIDRDSRPWWITQLTFLSAANPPLPGLMARSPAKVALALFKLGAPKAGCGWYVWKHWKPYATCACMRIKMFSQCWFMAIPLQLFILSILLLYWNERVELNEASRFKYILAVWCYIHSVGLHVCRALCRVWGDDWHHPWRKDWIQPSCKAWHRALERAWMFWPREGLRA